MNFILWTGLKVIFQWSSGFKPGVVSLIKREPNDWRIKKNQKNRAAWRAAKPNVFWTTSKSWRFRRGAEYRRLHLKELSKMPVSPMFSGFFMPKFAGKTGRVSILWFHLFPVFSNESKSEIGPHLSPQIFLILVVLKLTKWRNFHISLYGFIQSYCISFLEEWFSQWWHNILTGIIICPIQW